MEVCVQSLWGSIKSDLKGYLGEFCCKSPVVESSIENLDENIVLSIATSDVFVVERPGCPYCQSAHDTLRIIEDTSINRPSIVFKSTLSGSPLHSSLSVALGKPNLTFPVIFIRGRYIGGNAELQSSNLDQLLSAPFEDFIAQTHERTGKMFV
jgi:glutaredoxin